MTTYGTSPSYFSLQGGGNNAGIGVRIGEDQLQGQIGELRIYGYPTSGALKYGSLYVADATSDFHIGAENDIILVPTGGEVIVEATLSVNDGNIINVGDIALDSISSDDGTGVQFKQFKTVADNDGITLTTADAGQTITVDAAGAQTVVLPSVAAGDVGIWFRVVKLGAGQVTIDAADSDTIADSGDGDTVYCSIAAEDYTSITLQLASETEWVITGGHGTWVTTD